MFSVGCILQHVDFRYDVELYRARLPLVYGGSGIDRVIRKRAQHVLFTAARYELIAFPWCSSKKRRAYSVSRASITPQRNRHQTRGNITAATEEVP